jgi:peptidoglycan/xylan/chitin deacetylase (PgdA/CDA1 family)
MLIMRALARYWFVIPVAVIVIIGVQLFSGFVVVNGAKVAQRGPVPVVSTSMPTHTPRPVSEAALTPLFTPSPVSEATRTPTLTKTPTGTLTPTDTPSPTPSPTRTFTPTPGPTPIVADVALNVPILMYHYISEPPADADAIRRDLSVSPAQFESHLAYLRQAGYESITLRQLAYALSGQETMPAKPIVITFDDGYLDNYQNAFPLLQKYGYTGVFYIFTYPLDHDDPAYLTWEMVEKMHRAGMEFGSHGYRHWELAGRDVDFLVYEILGSKEAIEAHIGQPVRFFSYPVGRYDALAMQVVESANFWNAVTTEFDIEHTFTNRYALPRIRIHGYDTADKLAQKLDAF